AGIYQYPGVLRPTSVTTQVDERLPDEQSGRKYRSTTEYFYKDEFIQGGCPCSIASHLSAEHTSEEEAPVQGSNVGAFAPVKSLLSSYDYEPYGLMVSEVHESFEGGFGPDGKPPSSAKLKRIQITRSPSVPDTNSWLIQRYNSVSVTSTEPARDGVSASAVGPAISA